MGYSVEERAGGGSVAGEDDKVWVIGLEKHEFPPENDQAIPKTARPEPTSSDPPPPPPSRDIPLGWGLVASIAVGALLGVAIWTTLLRPDDEPEPVRYVVAKGDTLWHIARFHGVRVDQILAWNDMTSDAIEVGQVLLIHSPESSAAVEVTTKTGRKGTVRGGKVGGSPVSLPSEGALTLPPLQPCLEGPSLDDDEVGMAASVGLSHLQVSKAMNQFLPMLERCVPTDGAVGTVTFEITVGCSGRVAEARTVANAGLSSEVAACVQQTLRYAAFPAHDMADGFTFSYPMTFEFEPR